MSKELSKKGLFDYFKIALAVIPALSFVLACSYFYIFFSHFDGLGLNVLTVRDYVDKSVEFIPSAGLVFITGIFNLFLYPPRLQGESEEDHYKRIGGSKKIWKWHDRLIGVLFFLSIGVLAGAIYTPKMFFITLSTVLLFIFWGRILITVAKHAPPSFTNKFMTKPVLFLILGGMILICLVCSSAANRAGEIYRTSQDDQQVLIDILDVGYLFKKDGNLVLEDKDRVIIHSVRLETRDERSVFCRISKKFCFKTSVD